MSSQLGVSNGESSVPRAMIHKKILNVAESRPSASVEQLAAAVNGASADLVERVFEEYGDPAESQGPAGGSDDATEEQSQMEHPETNGDASEVDVRRVDEPSDPLTLKQREALRAIRVSPEATQAELAERFGVTQSTINNRLNSIEGFDWKRRQAFAEAALGDETPRAESGVAPGSTDGTGEDDRETDGADSANSDGDGAGGAETGTDVGAAGSDGDGPTAALASASASDPEPGPEVLTRLDELAGRVAALESRLGDAPPAGRDGEASVLGEPDLACKVVRACFDAPDITEAEEDRILRAAIESDGRT